MTNREIAALCAKEVHAERLKLQMNAQTFTLGKAADCIAGVLDRLGVQIKKAKKPAGPKSPAKMADEEWIQMLETEPALAGVNIRQEIGKAQFWAKHNRRVATRKMILNWLAKADRTMTVQMAGQSSKTVIKLDAYTEPPNWKQTAAALYPNTDYFTGKSWGEVALDYRKAIVQQILSA